MKYLYAFILATIMAIMIFLWLFANWLIFSIINHYWGWPGIVALSYTIATVLFFQGTRIQGWLDDLRHQ